MSASPACQVSTPVYAPAPAPARDRDRADGRTRGADAKCASNGSVTGGICSAARVFPLEGVKKDELDTALGYFENNAPRMRYHWFRRCGLSVGSGVVEASSKTVVGQRLKQSGMHWTVPGADAIIALRSQEASSTWEAICNTPHTQTSTA